MNQEDYLYGDCHIFAQALHEVFGYQMKLAIDEFDLELEKEVLVHAFCYVGNQIIDARGVSNATETLEPYDYNEVTFRKIEQADLEGMMEEGFVHRPEVGQYEKLVAYLQKNKERFQVEVTV